VTHDFQIPLFHHVYQGNVPDVALFPEVSRELIGRYTKLCADSPQDLTLVFDKGQVSDQGMENLIVPGTHFVAALPASRFPQLLASSELADVAGLPGTRAFATRGEFCATQVQFVTVYTESFFTQQLSGVTTNMVKCQKKLLDLDKALEKWHQGKAPGTKPTIKSVRTSVDQILSPQFMKELFQIHLTEKNKLPQLTYSVDHAALKKLTDERLGRTLLVTDRASWTTRETIEACRSLSSIENVFKNMKNTDFLHWQPTCHWTDQKIRVHGLYCILAFLLATLARKLVFQAGVEISLPAMLEELTGIREVVVIYPPGTLARPKDHITLSRMTSRQRKLAETLEVAQALTAG
jgi:transposase